LDRGPEFKSSAAKNKTKQYIRKSDKIVDWYEIFTEPLLMKTCGHLSKVSVQ
jgi:hypothetical protein